MESLGVTFKDEFPTRLERLRAAGVLRYDLVQAEPVWCGLGRDGVDDDVRGDHRGPSALPRGEALAGAREAVASYLAGHRASVIPEHVFFAPSRSAALRLALDVVARQEDEILVPLPARQPFDASEDAPRLEPDRLEFGEEWHLDRRSIRRAVGPRTRAILAGNPAEPTGAMLSAADLRALEELCAAREIALIGDEALVDTAIGTDVSVARAERVLALHVSGLTGVCGLPGAAWVAVAGAPPLTAAAAERLEVLSAARPEVPATALRSVAA
jgi:aspartate/methionine/tyrosine aminotransferase